MVGTLADDPKGAAALETGTSQPRRVRSPLVRSAVSLAGALAEWLHPSAEHLDHSGGTEPGAGAEEPDDTGTDPRDGDESVGGVAPEAPLASEAS